MTSVSVVVADDHAPTRAGVRMALESSGFAVVAEAEDAREAVAATQQHRPAVCLLDIHMPGNGISAARAIVDTLPGTAVVMLTVSRDDADLFDAIRAGAVGYLLKDTDPDRLPHALQGVLDGEAALPRNLVARLMEEFRGRDRRRLPLRKAAGARLTDREWEILEMMRQGLSTADMAERTFVSAGTVRSHISAILRKLQVPTREDAVRLLDD